MSTREPTTQSRRMIAARWTLSSAMAPLGIRSLLLLATSCSGVSMLSAQEYPLVPAIPISVAEESNVPPVAVQTWTREALEQRALQYHPALAEMWAQIQAAQGAYIQAGLQNNPNVGYSGQQIGSRGQAEQHGITVGKDIIRSEKLERSQAAAAGEVHRLQHQYETTRARIQTDLHMAYLNAYVAKLQIQLASELVAVAKRGVETVEHLRTINEASKGEVLQANIEVYYAENEAMRAQNRWRAAWQSLATLTCLPVDCPQELQGAEQEPAIDLDFCSVLAALKANSPELATAAAAIERNRLILARARVEPLPNLNVQGLVNWVDNGIAGRPDGALQVSVPIPVRNRNQGNIQQALQNLRASEQAYAKLELAIQNRLIESFEKYTNAKSAEERYRNQILPESKESLALIQIAYREGESNLNSFLFAQRTFSQLSISQLEAYRQRRIAEIEMEGLLLFGSFTN